MVEQPQNRKEANRVAPSPHNPRVFKCKVCGEIEHLGEKLCLCGANLSAQVEDEFAHWLVREKRKTTDDIRKTGRLSIILGVVGFSTSILFVIFGSIVDLFLEVFGPHGYLIVLSMYGLCCISVGLRRRKVRLEQRIVSLDFRDFLLSPYFKSLR